MDLLASAQSQAQSLVATRCCCCGHARELQIRTEPDLKEASQFNGQFNYIIYIMGNIGVYIYIYHDIS